MSYDQRSKIQTCFEARSLARVWIFLVTFPHQIRRFGNSRFTIAMSTQQKDNEHEDSDSVQQEEEEDVTSMTLEERREVVTNLSTLLEKEYIFPVVAQEMVQLLDKNITREDGKGYHSITDPRELAKRLTDDLQSISHDKHLKIKFCPEDVQKMRTYEKGKVDADEDDTTSAKKNGVTGDDLPPDMLKGLQFGNFGFKEVKILLGNVGYIDLAGFCSADLAGDTAAAAMNLVAHCSALIFDLRNNSGGSPSMIQLLTSYLYDGREKIHLNSFYWRPRDVTEQFWILPYVPGKRMPLADVYVLTSPKTFSAAEEFTYNLKNLKRATIVGETTGGGAHPGGTEIVADRFFVWLPKGRAINPITETNWEGKGVEPDIKVDSINALETAHLTALEKLIAECKDPVYAKLYTRHLDILKKKHSKKGDSDSK